ncbi:MAG TPA: DNA-directed RNA polymerase subunit N [Candidatus Poseidoniales archaeon]|jgi:DNA-directed RNA polymerase I, II, and III subunit RPABC5|nr:MAG: DNA-directed RNA polymerase subunit N [Euryarchaeota archaeon]HIG03637.1 DNA-directed RNA polymerase subunit N [Candidatus Poseidoniales archaeon]HIK77916.1 DNA-directed RNA polymerase subunit N [Candidatus Poseidoniales archaeon]
MIIPVRCFSCGTVVADRWQSFTKLLDEGVDKGEAMDQLGLERYCCRRMFTSHIDLIHEIAPFSTARQK